MARGALRFAFVLATTLTLRAAGPEAVALGESGHFTLLAGAAITTTGGGSVTGDAGVSPAAGSTIGLTDPQVNGIIYAVDVTGPAGSIQAASMLTVAKGDLTVAYNAAAGRTPVPTGPFLNPGFGNIGGLTLVPGLYKFTTECHIEGSDLTLTGGPDDVWIFQVGTALIMGADGRKIILAGGARARNIFWQVGSSAVIGTFAEFKGTIMADQSIVFDTSSVLEGRALARIGQITFNGRSAILPSLQLEVVSEHGLADLPVGIHDTNFGSLLSNRVTAVETLFDTQYEATGWIMTGNAPFSGTGTNMTMVHTNDAVLTWLWSTNYYLDASADLNGSVSGNANGFYAAGSTGTVTALPDLGYHFVIWTGDFSGSPTSTTQTLIMDQPRALVAHFAVDRVTLEIVSEHGVPNPLVGLYTHDYGSLLTNRVSAVETLIDTQYESTGWRMVGNVPFSGSGTNMTMVHTNNAVLTWLWSTNYLLDASADVNGSVSGSANGFYADGTTATVTAIPDVGYHFMNWTGDFTGPATSATQAVILDQPRALVAHFVRDSVTLRIVSEHGVANPPVGLYTHDYGSLLTNRVTAMETLIDTQYESTGWRMVGNAPFSASGTNMVMVHTNNAVLTWLWSTNFLLDASADLNGSVSGSANGFYADGASATVTATPNIGYHFTNWTGDFTGPATSATQTVILDQPRALVAHFGRDSVTLRIVSEHGVANPPVGLYTHDYGSLLTNRVTAMETLIDTQYASSGWRMVGNVPFSGSGTNMTMVHTNNAVLTWLWSTNYLLDASADLNGSVSGSANGFYADGASATVTATPNIGYHFTNWTGDFTGPATSASQTVILDQPRALVAHFARDRVTLEIVSEHGVANPPMGQSTHDYGTQLTNRVTALETLGGTQYASTGWRMVGNGPFSGSGTNMVMVHTNNAVLTWLWSTNFLLNASADLNGSVSGSANGFYADGASATVTATPNIGYHFTNWTGDFTGPATSVTQLVVMNQPRTLVAHFAVDRVTLQVVSEHGVAMHPVGIHTFDYGTAHSNSVTDVVTVGGTQYIATGWTLTDHGPLLGTGTSMAMVHTNNTVLTWEWSTNHFLSLVADHGSITNAVAGFKPAGWAYDLYPRADAGYGFDHWEVGGLPLGNGVPLNVIMSEPRDVVAFFTPLFVDVSTQIVWSVNWVFDPRKGFYLGTLAITNPLGGAGKNLLAPFWFEVEHTAFHWLRFPSGNDAGTGLEYLDLSPAIAGKLPGIGNGDTALNPGETVTVSGIELMGRRTTDGILMAVWADPPGTSTPDTGTLDTDHDGIPNAWELLHPSALNLSNPLDGALDADGDGMSSGAEYVAGTDPADRASLFRIRACAAGPGVEWSGHAGRVYTVWASPEPNGVYHLVADGIVRDGPAVCADSATRPGNTGPTQFYRVEAKLITGDAQ